MADEQTTTDTSGVTRTSDGTIAEPGTTQSNATTATTQTTTATGTETATQQSNDGKSVLNQKAEGEKKEEPAKGAPDKYADYTVPDGFTIDPEVKTKADALFKGMGLDQAQAQSLVDMYRELTTEAFQAPFKAYQDTVAGWLAEAKDHPDLRGKLAPGGEVNVRFGKLLNGVPDAKLASDFREAMDITGVGNHPAFIRLMDHFAKQLTEGTHVAGNGPSKHGQSAPNAPSQPNAAAAMWPNLPSASGSR